MGLSEADLARLAEALTLAERGRRTAAPNPVVGCVLERGGEVLGVGWHERPGGPHAEVAALRDCREDPRGATAFVTLEPCARWGRTPPCTEALLEAGVVRVVCAARDPTQEGLERLRAGGVRVDVLPDEHPLARHARRQTAAFRTWAVRGRPHVRYKAAVTLDGRTATRTGDARWISGPEARRLVHGWRAEAGAVLVGIGTALADDPDLTPRDADPPAERLPLRVVVDPGARLPLDGRLARTAGAAPVLVLVGDGAPAERRAALERAGVEVVPVPGLGSAPGALRDALTVLARRSVTDVLLEGGATLAGAMLGAGLVDRLLVFVAPLLVADPAAPALLGPAGDPPEQMAAAARLVALESRAVGPDILLDGWLRDPP